MNKKNKKNFLSGLASKPEFSTIVLLVVMIVVMIIVQQNFFEQRSISSNINAIAPLALLAMGQAIVIISGGIDLSIGSAMSLLLCIMTKIMHDDNSITGVYAILVAIPVAVAIGLINGLAVGYLRLPPIIATFATSYLYLGAALFVTPTASGDAVDWFVGFYDLSKVPGLSENAAAVFKLIQPGLILVLLGCVLWAVVRRTRTGRHMYAVGSNEENSYASGINTGRIKLYAYLVEVFFVMLAALFYAGQNGAGSARVGDPMTIKAISAAVVGGIALSGGRGNVIGAIGGACILHFINKIIFFADISSAYQTLVNGVIVLLAIASSELFNAIRGKKLLEGGLKNEA